MSASTIAEKNMENYKSKNLFTTVSKFSKDYMAVVAILIMVVVFSFASPYFFTELNLKNILLQTATVGVVTIGQALLIATGQFDLSLGQNACFSGCVAAYLMGIMGINPFVAILIALLVGTTIGALNGFLYAYCGIPAFMATLGLQNVAKGLAKVITNATPIGNLPEQISFLGRGYIGPVPICVIILIGLFVLVAFMVKKTKFGRSIFAIGGGSEASFFSGINVKRVSLLTFTIAGFFAAFGGIILISRLNSAAITNGNNYEFDAVIASVVGGLSLTGGKGKVINALFGSIFLVMFFNGMTMLNVDPFWQDVLKGVVLVAAVGLDVFRNRKRQ